MALKRKLKSGLKRLKRKIGDTSIKTRIGFVGTEPVARRNKRGGFTRGTEVKFGKLGSVFIKKRKRRKK